MLKQLMLAALIVAVTASANSVAAKVIVTTVEVPVEVADVRGGIVRQSIKSRFSGTMRGHDHPS